MYKAKVIGMITTVIPQVDSDPMGQPVYAAALFIRVNLGSMRLTVHSDGVDRQVLRVQFHLVLLIVLNYIFMLYVINSK